MYLFCCVKTTCLLILTVAQVPALEQNPLRGQKRHEIEDIWPLTRVSYHSSSSSSPSPFILVIVIAIIIVVIIIITIIIYLVYYLLVSSLLLSIMPRCRLVFLSMCGYRISFWSKTSSSISPFVMRTNLQTLQHSVVQCSWNLAWATVLGHVAWHLFIGTLLGNLCLGSLAWELVLGSLFLGTCSWEHCLVTCSWELSLGNLFLEYFACLLQTCSLGPCSGTCFS